MLLKGTPGEAYNIGNDEVTTIKQMAEIYSKTGNVKLKTAIPTEEEVKRFNSMNASTLNIDKVKKLGFKNVFTVEEGLIHTVEILKDLIRKK